MSSYALASTYHRLSPTQQSQITHIIPDDGEWTLSMIQNYIQMFSSQTCEADREVEKREGWAV